MHADRHLARWRTARPRWFDAAARRDGVAVVLAAAAAGAMGLIASELVGHRLASVASGPYLAALAAGLAAAVAMGFARRSLRLRRELGQARTALIDLNAGIVETLGRLVAQRDGQEDGHAERVARNAVTVARALGRPEQELQWYFWAGMLHDLGKLDVRESVLRKCGRLTSDEMAEARQHPACGEQILLDLSPAFTDVATGVRAHHERWDGHGYPDALAGERIPLMARVLAVVDVFEALTTSRPYRAPLSRQRARGVLQEGAGSQFDPNVVAVFLTLEGSGAIARALVPEAPADPMAAVERAGADALRALN